MAPGADAPRIVLPAFLICLLLQGFGCTRQLWEPTGFAAAKHPETAIYLSRDGTDFLVAFNLRVAGGRNLGRRAYFIRANENRPDFTAPMFVSPALTNDLVCMPLVSPSASVTHPRTGWLAVGMPLEPAFTLFHDGQRVLDHRLPFFREVTHRGLRTLLTVPAAAIDGAGAATMGGVSAGAAGVYVLMPGPN